MSLITYSANFNGVELTTISGLTVLATNPYIPAERSLTSAIIARTNKSKVNSAFYQKRDILVRFGITRATRDLAEQSLDSLMKIIQGQENDLLLRQSGGTRKYNCTYSDIVMRVQGGSYIEADLIFVTSDHFGYDNATTLLTQVSNFTSAQKTTQINVGGSAPWQVPVITITYTALTGGSNTYVIVGNDNTGQAVLIRNNFAAGDVIEIDSKNQTVKVNGVELAFTGAIPEWSPGIGYITVTDTFTSRTMSMRMDYSQRWV